MSQSTGKLEGRIADNADGAIAQARITISNESGKYEIWTDQTGQYSINLPAGEYDLTAQAKAFITTKESHIKVTIGHTTEHNLMLAVNLDELRPYATRYSSNVRENMPERKSSQCARQAIVEKKRKRSKDIKK